MDGGVGALGWNMFPQGGGNKYAGLLYLPASYITAMTFHFPANPETDVVPFLVTGGIIAIFLFFLKPLERMVLGVWLLRNAWVRRSFWSPFVAEARAMTFSVPYLIGALLVFLSRWRSVAIYLRLTGPQTDLAVGLLALATLALGFAAGVSFVQFLSAVGTVEEYYGLQGEWAFNKATLPPSRLEKYLALMRKAMQRNDWDDANYELRKIKLRYHLFSGSA